MSHLGQKLGLCLVCLVGLLCQEHPALFTSLLFADKPCYIQYVGHVAKSISLLHNKSCRVPVAVVGEIIHGYGLVCVETFCDGRQIKEIKYLVLIFGNDEAVTQLLHLGGSSSHAACKSVYLVIAGHLLVHVLCKIYPVY